MDIHREWQLERGASKKKCQRRALAREVTIWVSDFL